MHSYNPCVVRLMAPKVDKEKFAEKIGLNKNAAFVLGVSE